MKKLSKFASLFAMLLIVLGSVSCKQEPEPTPVDTTAPANVTNLVATAKDTRVLLTWTDATDDDIFGYEVSYSGTNSNNRAVSAMEKNSLFVAQGTGGTYVSGLANGTEYTFTVKAMDTSGNKSNGVTASASPKAGDPLKISLDYDVPTSNAYTPNYKGTKSNTTVTVTANITSTRTVKKVVYKKDGSINAKTLLDDEGAIPATKDSSDDKKWTFVISATDETANGIYTVAAIDEAGREEAEQITINNFDFTAPAKVTNINGKYENGLIELTWTNPTDDDFDKIEITYSSSDDGLTYDSESIPKFVSKEKTNETFGNNIDGVNNASYKFKFISIDKLGNRRETIPYTVIVNESLMQYPEGFVFVKGKEIAGTETWTPSSDVFVSGRKITIRDLIVCDHEVTQKEYETYCLYGYSTSSSSTAGFLMPSENYGRGENCPVYYVSWFDAIVYCNLRSIAEGFDPVYKLDGEPDPRNWYKIYKAYGLCCGPLYINDTSFWKNSITMNIEENGYRLPTRAEWEYLARGGREPDSYEYSGSDNINDVAWNSDNSGNKVHDVKGKMPNKLGLYDMSGNVFEWCWDWNSDYSCSSSTPETGPDSNSERKRCYLGGSYYNDYKINLRSYSYDYSRTSSQVGFRVVRTATSN